MTSKKEPIKIACLFFLMLCIAGPVWASDKKEKEKLDRLSVRIEEMKTEIVTVGRQMQDLQDAINRAAGELSSLITQINDNVSAIRRAHSAVSTYGNDATTRMASMGERLTATNERMERLSEQFAALRKLIEDIPKQSSLTQITPNNPERLFATAYSDYTRGNDALALSEFQQYVETYPDSELADNATYWIGEILYAQKRYQDAIDTFSRVFAINPKGDKAAIALYKRALALADMGQRDGAVAQLNALVKAYPTKQESEMAKQRLQEWRQSQTANP